MGAARRFYKGLETPRGDPTFGIPTQERKGTMANLTRFDPFNELVDDLFNGFLVRPVAYQGRAMKVDIAEKNGHYTVAAELPGVRKDDIQVSIDGTEVTLSAEVKREKQVEQDERVLHTERVYGKLSRTFSLPQEVDEAKAEARFRDGVLELTLPKKAAAARKQITIQ
jgi:HSP20 family protein